MASVSTIKSRVASLDMRRAQTLTTRSQRMTGRRLQHRNALFLSANPLCVHCQAAGRVTAACEVDHKTPLHLGGVDGEPNLQGLCSDCHDVKTAAEARDRAGGGKCL